MLEALLPSSQAKSRLLGNREFIARDRAPKPNRKGGMGKLLLCAKRRWVALPRVDDRYVVSCGMAVPIGPPPDEDRYLSVLSGQAFHRIKPLADLAN
jgi:hypothetical protein